MWLLQDAQKRQRKKKKANQMKTSFHSQTHKCLPSDHMNGHTSLAPARVARSPPLDGGCVENIGPVTAAVPAAAAAGSSYRALDASRRKSFNNVSDACKFIDHLHHRTKTDLTSNKVRSSVG